VDLHVGPEFKPQYCSTGKKKNAPHTSAQVPLAPGINLQGNPSVSSALIFLEFNIVSKIVGN
jgi:hypothetical protein